MGAIEVQNHMRLALMHAHKALRCLENRDDQTIWESNSTTQDINKNTRVSTGHTGEAESHATSEEIQIRAGSKGRRDDQVGSMDQFPQFPCYRGVDSFRKQHEIMSKHVGNASSQIFPARAELRWLFSNRGELLTHSVRSIQRWCQAM